MKSKTINLLIILTLLGFSRISLANDCFGIATKILRASPNKNKLLTKKIDEKATGLISEIGQNPTHLFINPSAIGPGFDSALLQVVKTFVEDTPKAEIIIPLSKKDFVFLAQFDLNKKEIIDFMLTEEKAKRLKINYLFQDKEIASDAILWTRDYAPVKIFNNKTKKYELLAFKYAKAEPKNESGYKQGMRYVDDIQQKIADTLKLKLKRSKLVMEGGNMLSDNKGNVFTSTKILENNPEYSMVQIEKELIDLGFAEKIIWITKLPSEIEPTGHVDLIMRFIDSNKVVVPSSKNKKANVALNKIAKELEVSGLMVERIEMNAKPVQGIDGIVAIESHMNALQLQSTIIIPQYGTSFDQEAQNFYQGLGLNVTFATGETMKAAGSIHCMTYTY